MNLQLSASRVNDEAPQISGQSGASGNLIGAAYSAPPTWPNDPNFFVAGNRLNPRNILDNFLGEGQTTRYLLNGSLEYSITNELSACEKAASKIVLSIMQISATTIFDRKQNKTVFERKFLMNNFLN